MKTASTAQIFSCKHYSVQLGLLYFLFMSLYCVKQSRGVGNPNFDHQSETLC